MGIFLGVVGSIALLAALNYLGFLGLGECNYKYSFLDTICKTANVICFLVIALGWRMAYSNAGAVKAVSKLSLDDDTTFKALSNLYVWTNTFVLWVVFLLFILLIAGINEIADLVYRIKTDMDNELYYKTKVNDKNITEKSVE